VPDWDAEVAIDGALVRALLSEQFPELDADSARFIGEGWDNSVWAVEERWAFRFPRRAIAIPLVERELTVLPRLAPLLPVPVPEPRFGGVPSDRFPWPFFGGPLLAGRELADAGLVDEDCVELGSALARFLRVLHSHETLDVVDPDRALPVDFNRRSDMAFRVPRARENLAHLHEAGHWNTPAALEQILAAAELLPPSRNEAVLTHGDLHRRHVLVSGGTLAAVIDFGDTCLADPCIDLVLVWSVLAPSGRERFFSEYGPVSDEQLLRSRVLAIGLDSMLARYAHDVGHATLQREALAGLERALID
jgi:aminoglycoside phosphotransferase (APT) family kinase protein